MTIQHSASFDDLSTMAAKVATQARLASRFMRALGEIGQNSLCDEDQVALRTCVGDVACVARALRDELDKQDALNDGPVASACADLVAASQALWRLMCLFEEEQKVLFELSDLEAAEFLAGAVSEHAHALTMAILAAMAPVSAFRSPAAA